MSPSEALLLLEGIPQVAHARRSDPLTSHAAAASVRVTDTQDRILVLYRMYGPATDDETTERFHNYWPDRKATPQSIRTRRKELERKGLIEATGRYGTSANGGKATIWQAVVL